MKHLTKSLWAALCLSAMFISGLYAQVNESRYIRIGCNGHLHITLNLRGIQANTPIKVGSDQYTITNAQEGTNVTLNQTGVNGYLYIYGDVVGLNMSSSTSDVTDIGSADFSKNLIMEDIRIDFSVDIKDYPSGGYYDFSEHKQLKTLYLNSVGSSSPNLKLPAQIESITFYSSNTVSTTVDASKCSKLSYLVLGMPKLSVTLPEEKNVLKTLRLPSCDLTSFSVLDYPNLENLYLRNNNLTALHLRGLDKLSTLDIHGNDNLSANAYNEIMCALPDRTGKDKGGYFTPLDNSSSDGAKSKFTASNGSIATDKNWQISGPVTSTTGDYACVNEDLYIKGTTHHYAEKDEVSFGLYFKQDAPVRITSELIDTTIVRSTEGWSYFPIPVERDGQEFYIYGDIISADFESDGGGGLNYEVFDAIEVHNDSLRHLFMNDADFLPKKVANLRTLRIRNSSSTLMNDLDLTACKNLETLFLYKCSTKTLKINSKNLTKVHCYQNKMTTESYNDLMCQLPETTDGIFCPLQNTSDANADTITATNANIAKNKGWKVVYAEDNGTEIATNGKYDCNSGLNDEPEDNSFVIYPNPAQDEIMIEGIHNSLVEIYDLNGRLVKSVITDGNVNVSNLTSGIYHVKIGEQVSKLVIK